MDRSLIARIQALARPMEPLPSGESSRSEPLAGIRAVLFDVYGTLLISASGELELTGEGNRAACLAEALRSLGIEPPATCSDATEWLSDEIRARHTASRSSGIDVPEVEIRSIWRNVWRKWRDVEPALPEEVDIEALAVEYEMRVNPVWTMPHADACLAQLAQRGITLGLISNAQFFTPLVLAALLNGSPEELGFTPELCLYSFEYGWAKPAGRLYELSRERLQLRGISPQEVLYVGNDMRNDVVPAARVGFHTALFAGDRRSLRWREQDPSVAGCRPDRVVVDLNEIPASVLQL